MFEHPQVAAVHINVWYWDLALHDRHQAEGWLGMHSSVWIWSKQWQLFKLSTYNISDTVLSVPSTWDISHLQLKESTMIPILQTKKLRNMFKWLVQEPTDLSDSAGMKTQVASVRPCALNHYIVVSPRMLHYFSVHPFNSSGFYHCFYQLPLISHCSLWNSKTYIIIILKIYFFPKKGFSLCHIHNAIDFNREK